MIILLDFDNLEKNFIRVDEILYRKIVALLDLSDLLERRVLIRLYSGWYNQDTLTRKAQKIDLEVRNNFPMTAFLSDNKNQVIVNCEMAYSTLSDPQNHLLYTYRESGIPSGLKSYSPRKVGCNLWDCPLIDFHEFLKKGTCHVCDEITINQFMYRSEQKLVDSMITCDIIHESNKSGVITIVSDDSDFWPGINYALMSGKKVIRIVAKNSRISDSYLPQDSRRFSQRIIK